MTDTDYWRVDMEKAVIGDIKVLTSADSAIIDSGTSFIAMPTSDLESLVTLLESVHKIVCEWSDLLD